MANQEHLDQLKEGVTTWNQWRQAHPAIQPDLSEAHLEGANLAQARLEGANLIRARLEGADLLGAHLEGADLSYAHLEGVNLRLAFLDSGTSLGRATFGDEQHGYPFLVDVHWGDALLSVVDWSQIKKLGEEREARQLNTSRGKRTAEERKKARKSKIDHYRWAVRANRQLAVVLRSQGLSEEADYFAYRAQVLQRVLWWWQRKPLKYLLSWFLYILAGYGYKPIRSLLLYLLVIGGFAAAYYILGQTPNMHLSYGGALVFSVTSFHGRGFFPGAGITSLDDPFIRLAALEAIIGLLIEVSFIATFTQRFFGR